MAAGAAAPEHPLDAAAEACPRPPAEACPRPPAGAWGSAPGRCQSLLVSRALAIASNAPFSEWKYTYSP